MFKNGYQRQGCCQNERECCNRQCPVMEPTITNCIEKEFCHEVEHIIPVHTHVINKHIYNHVYKPQYSCSEECQVINNQCGNNYMNR